MQLSLELGHMEMMPNGLVKPAPPPPPEKPAEVLAAPVAASPPKRSLWKVGGTTVTAAVAAADSGRPFPGMMRAASLKPQRSFNRNTSKRASNEPNGSHMTSGLLLAATGDMQGAVPSIADDAVVERSPEALAPRAASTSGRALEDRPVGEAVEGEVCEDDDMRRIGMARIGQMFRALKVPSHSPVHAAPSEVTAAPTKASMLGPASLQAALAVSKMALRASTGSTGKASTTASASRSCVVVDPWSSTTVGAALNKVLGLVTHPFQPTTSWLAGSIFLGTRLLPPKWTPKAADKP